LKCCRPNPPCRYFCRLNGKLIAGQGVIRNPETGWEYEVLKIIALGGMSTTYLVYSYQLRKLAVLKEISAELLHKSKAREMFQREARVLKSLQHRGIPQYYDFFCTQEHYFLVMEMVHGQNLEQIAPVTSIQALKWLQEVCKILNYLHLRNPPVIHRDIKPANLILRYKPRQIVLIDFGAVKEATAPPGTRIATPGYSAPEQQKGLPCIQSDFYALGTTLIYLITKQSPSNFYDSHQHKFINLESVAIPPTLIRVILALTAFDPKERPQHATEVNLLLEKSQTALIESK
jgi:serine/threonine-protein kinase